MSSEQEQVVDPWAVKGATVNGINQAIDYNKLIEQFGTQKITPDLLDQLEAKIGKLHHLIRRRVFFSHRDLQHILEKPFYLYTGRGPSSGMHVGHFVPFVICQWLQKVFDIPIVIQLTDDEKFYFKDLTLEQTTRTAYDNIKDIIACGFDLSKTFIFINSEYMNPPFYKNICKINRLITTSQSKNCFGFKDSDSIGKLSFVSVQAAPAFSSSFPHIFGNVNYHCLIPCAIDQDPYFRLTRDVASRLKAPKPILLLAKFFPALQGPSSKMSSSDENSAIFLTDTPNQIKKKINKYAFSGGKDTVEEHRLHGGNTDVDTSYQYLTFFLEDDAELLEIKNKYKSGEMLSGEIKQKCIEVLQRVVGEFQDKRAKVSDSVVQEFLSSQRIFEIDGFKKRVEEAAELKKKDDALKKAQADLKKQAKIQAKKDAQK